MDLEAVLGELGTLDRKAVRQLRNKGFQTALAALPVEERVLAVLPVALNDIRGPLVVTDRNLVFVSSVTGTRLVDGLSDVKGTHFTHIGSGFLHRKRFDLAIEVGDNEVHFSTSGNEKIFVWFAHALEVGQEMVGAPSIVGSSRPSTDEDNKASGDAAHHRSEENP